LANTNSTGPKYYRRGSIQVWDFIRDQGLNFHLGNAIKYICRAGYKDDRKADLQKAIHYLQNELENEILNESSQRVSAWLSSEEQYWDSFTGDAEAFDR
jgi:predicted Ser/Thr protein kinase